jgi:hypothetical protein
MRSAGRVPAFVAVDICLCRGVEGRRRCRERARCYSSTWLKCDIVGAAGDRTVEVAVLVALGGLGGCGQSVERLV